MGILIVDDQKANVLLLEQMLRGAGYTSVSSTMVPEQVCELHRQNRYSLILLDLLMPGMDGFQVMEVHPALFSTDSALKFRELAPVLVSDAHGVLDLGGNRSALLGRELIPNTEVILSILDSCESCFE